MSQQDRIYEMSSTVETETITMRWKIEKFYSLPILHHGVCSVDIISSGITWRVYLKLKISAACEEPKNICKRKVVFQLSPQFIPNSVAHDSVHVRFGISGETFSAKQEKVVNLKILEPLPPMNFGRETVLQSCSASKDLIVTCQLETAWKLRHMKGKEEKCVGTTDSVHDVQCLSTLSSDLQFLFSRKEFIDVMLKVEEVEFPAHRTVLAARSPVFAAMFRQELLETKASINITDISAPIFEKILMFIYSGNLPEITASDVGELYTAANKYALLELKKKCVEIMLNELSDDNLIRVVTVATQQADNDLIEAADDFLQKNLSRILSTQQWMDFSRHQSDIYKIVVERLLLRKAN